MNQRERLALVERMLVLGTVVPGEQLEAALGVSRRTVYRYIEMLRQRGLRIASGNGQGGGYIRRKEVRSAGHDMAVRRREADTCTPDGGQPLAQLHSEDHALAQRVAARVPQPIVDRGDDTGD